MRRYAIVAMLGLAALPWSPLVTQSSHLETRWAQDVRPDHVLPEYPRPQLVRNSWINLNGLWDYAVRDSAAATGSYDGAILVPFPIESQLHASRAPSRQRNDSGITAASRFPLKVRDDAGSCTSARWIGMQQ